MQSVEEKPLDVKIVEFLTTQTAPVATLTIAKEVGLTTAKEVNPTLYRLLTAKRVIRKTEEGGKKPQWSINPDSKPSELEAKIIDTLEGAKTSLPARKIAQLVVGEKALAKDVNPSLYSLLNRKYVEKVAHPTKKQPQWRVKGSTVPILE